MSQPVANVFGVQFPVCSEEQKDKLEAAFKSACEYEREYGEFRHDCTCDLITALLYANTPRSASILAAWAVARDIYNKKQVWLILQSLLQPPPPEPVGRAN